MTTREIIRILHPSPSQIAWGRFVAELECGHRVLCHEGMGDGDMMEHCPWCEMNPRWDDDFCYGIDKAAEARCDADYRVVPRRWDWISWAWVGVCAVLLGLCILFGGNP